MKIKALHIFKGIQEFFRSTEFIEQVNWRIEKQLLKDRVQIHKSLSQFSIYKDKFYTKNLSIWDLKDEEIITWFDTCNLLRRVFVNILKKGVLVDDLYIIMEYPLVNGNYMRSDYLLVYERLIFVLEFGMFNQDEKRSEERYTKKLQESVNYRQIIANQVSKDIVVTNYVMIYKPEYDRISNSIIKDNVLYNNEELKKLIRYISNTLHVQQELKAIKQLESLEIINN